MMLSRPSNQTNIHLAILRCYGVSRIAVFFFINAHLSFNTVVIVNSIVQPQRLNCVGRPMIDCSHETQHCCAQQPPASRFAGSRILLVIVCDGRATQEAATARLEDQISSSLPDKQW